MNKQNQSKYSVTHRGFLIMSNDDLGFNENIADAIIDRILDYTAIHSQSFVMMFTIQYPQRFDSQDNSDIQEFVDRFTKHLEYYKLDPVYVWCREKNTAINQHYHILLILDGHKIQNRYGIMEEAKRLWTDIIGHSADGLIDYSWEPWRLRRSSQSFQKDLSDCIFALSYLAKTNTKGGLLYRQRTYGCSHLKR